jgi:C4-dicarboxylate-specific signal transduction histidine kinase
MLEKAKTHSLATLVAKYLRDLDRLRKTKTNNNRKSLSANTEKYRRRLDATFDKHHLAMHQKSSDMEELANALIKNSPFEAENKIGYVTKDTINDIKGAIAMEQAKSIAEWTARTILTQSWHHASTRLLTMPSLNEHTLGSMDTKIQQRQIEITRLNDIIDNCQQGFITFLDTRQQDFESEMHAIIDRESNNTDGSTLNNILKIETTTAIEQMVKIRDKSKQTSKSTSSAKNRPCTNAWITSRKQSPKD